MTASRCICFISSIILIAQMSSPVLALGSQGAAGGTNVAEPAVPAQAVVRHDDEFTDAKVAALDRQIMLECIKLARFNLRFHASVNAKNFEQQWIYPLEREAGTALSFSNTMVDLSQRARGLDGVNRISRPARKRGVECALTGQSVTGTSSGIELLTNLIQSRQARNKGYSPARTVATVQESIATIDKLLAARAQVLLADGIQDEHHVYALQGRLLEHIKNQLVFEFKTWSIRSRSVEWSENTFYAIDSLQGFTQMGSSCTSMKAFSTRHLGGGAAIINLVANAMVMFNPVVRTLAGRCAADMEGRRLDNSFTRGRPKPIEAVLAEWGTSADEASKRNASTIEAKELAFLVRRSAEMDDPLNKEVAKFERLRRIADQQAVSGPLIGLTGVTRGILNTVAHYSGSSARAPASSSTSSTAPSSNSSSSSSSSSAAHSRFVANELNFAGRVVQSTGQTYSLILTPLTEVRHYVYKRRLEKAGTAPAQILKARLEKLDALEARIKTSKFEL